MATQMYYSREDRIAEINGPEERVQYQDPGEDEFKSLDPVYATAEALLELEHSVQTFFTECKEGPPSAIKKSREELVYNWALAQASLSKVAWVLRIDGNDALQRLVTAIKNRNTVDMEGL